MWLQRTEVFCRVWAGRNTGWAELVRCTQVGPRQLPRGLAADPSGRLLSVVRRGTNGTLMTLRTALYDSAGRLIRETNATGGASLYGETLDAESQRVAAVTNADGGTLLETYYRDGQLKIRTGTAVFPSRFEYGRESDGGYQRASAKEIKLNADGTDSSEWTKTYEPQGSSLLTLSLITRARQLRPQQVRHMRPDAQVQPPRDSCQCHRRLLPPAPRDAHLARIALPPLGQFGLPPAQFLEFLPH